MNKNVEIFNDTKQRIEGDARLIKLTAELKLNTKVYPERFFSQKIIDEKICNVTFEENLTLIAARKCVEKGNKTAVLNFANPVEPGGGVLRGANAQEEYLCRASNLYDSLCSEAAKPFYQLHNDIMMKNRFNGMFVSTDTVIYSKQVTVFKVDKGYLPDTMDESTQEYTEDWFNVDVITCSAPFFSGTDNALPNEDLKRIFKNRIKNIFEVAIDNNVHSLILGAFGCGAFHNPPHIVANAFSEVLQENRYKNAFSDVIFAVKRSGSFCENIEAFEITFTEFPPSGKYIFSPERNKRRFFE